MEKSDIGNAMAELALANSRMQRTQDYVQRGRRHQDASGQELETLFVDTFRAWVADFGNRAQRRGNDDVSAEYELRGIEPPFHLVGPEMDALTKVAREVAADPEALEGIGQSIVDEWVEAQTKKN